MIDTLISLPVWVKLVLTLILINLVWNSTKLFQSQSKIKQLREDEKKLKSAYDELMKASELQKEALLAQLKELENSGIFENEAPPE